MQFFCSTRTSLLVVIMKIILVALFCFSAALATPELTPDNDFEKSVSTSRGTAWLLPRVLWREDNVGFSSVFALPPMYEMLQNVHPTYARMHPGRWSRLHEDFGMWS